MVINSLHQIFKDEDDVGIAFVYCDYKEYHTSAELIGSLLQQLVQRQTTISLEIRQLYYSHGKKNTRPSLSEYSKLLRSESRTFSNVFIVIDALDECEEYDGTRAKLLSEIQKLQPIVRLLVTSRPHITNVISKFKDSTRLDIRASDEDIKRYLEGRIEEECRLKRHVDDDPSLKDTIINAILGNVDGM